MPSPRRSLPRTAAVGLVVLALGAGLGLGQQLSSINDLESAFKKNQSKFNKLVFGDGPPTAGDKEMIETAAKWYVHRFNDRSIAQSDSAKFAEFHKEFERDLIERSMTNSAKNREFRDQMGNALTRAIRPFLEQDFLESRVPLTNAALLLPQMARLRGAEKPEKDRAAMEELGDYLAALLADPKKHEVIRLFAAEGLKEFFPVQAFTELSDPGDKNLMKKKERDVARVEALARYIEQTYPADLPKEEADAIRYQRCTALESLAQAGVPAVSALKKAGKADGLVAATLMKVLAGKGITPEPGLGEKIEAALGLMQMKFTRQPDFPEYVPEMGVFLVGKALDDFANEYSKDFVNIKVRRYPTMQPWKVQAKRLEAGLKDMVANTTLEPGRTSVLALQKAVSEVNLFPSVQNTVQLDRIQQFRTDLARLRPKNTIYFKTIKAPEIELP